MRTIIRDCQALVPDDGGGVRQTHADIVVEGNLIAAIDKAGAARPRPGDRVIAGGERLAAPGLVNAHSHSLSSVLRGTGDRLGHVTLLWQNQADSLGRTSEERYVSAVLSACEMVRSGVTSVIDHYPEQNCRTEDVDPIARAYADVGMRAAVALRIFDRPYDDLDPSQVAGVDAGVIAGLARDNPLKPMPADALAAVCEEAIAKWNGHAGLISIFPAPSNPTRCTDALLVRCHEIAEKFDTGVHTHLQETRIQRDVSIKYNRAPIVVHLESLGILSHRWSMAHTVWVDDEEIALMAKRQAVPVHNPESNAKIKVGNSPVVKMLQAGVPVALGADGSSTNDNQNLFEAMMLAVLLPRITGEDKAGWPGAPEAFAMATTAGAKAMMRDGQIGALAVGRRADIVLYDLMTPNLAPLNDAVQQLVFSERGASVRTVLVEGQVVYEDGRFAFGDVAEVAREAVKMRARQLERNPELYRLTRQLVAAQTRSMT